jgi:antitoxin YefM
VKTVPLADAKARFSQLVDQVASRDERVLITRNGRPAAVLLSADEYDSLSETIAIRADRDLMAEIRRGLRGLKRGGKIYTLEELLPES